MDAEGLDARLRTLTDSERWHRGVGPDVLSPRYSLIDRVPYKGREVFRFHFGSLLKDSSLCLMKESRFAAIPEHVHATVEILYIYSGMCTQVIDGRPIRMSKGDLCMLDRDVAHSIEATGENDILITIDMRKSYFTGKLMTRLGQGGIINSFFTDALSENVDHDAFLLFRSISAKAADALAQILCEHYDPQVYGGEMVSAHLVLLFCELLRQFRSLNYNGEDSTSRLVIRILDYIETHYPTASLDDLANELGFHPNYLSTFIKRHIGRNFMELVIDQRMRQAAYLLVNTKEPIAQVAMDIGYDNLGFFYRKFEGTYSTTPRGYREAHEHEMSDLGKLP